MSKRHKGQARTAPRKHYIDDYEPSEFLKSRGFTEDHKFWTLPSSDYNPTTEEYDAIDYLMDEWGHTANF